MNVARERCRARAPRAVVRGLALVALIASAVACETLPSADVRRAPPPDKRADAWTIDHDAYAEMGYRLDWRGFPAVSGGKDPVELVHVADDMILVLDQSSVLSALAPSDGSTLWRYELANALTNFKGIGVADDLVVAVSESDIYVLDPAAGTLVDRIVLDRVANTAPIISGDSVIYGTSRGEIRLVSIRSRLEIWGNALYGQRAPGPMKASPIIVGGVIGAVTQGGEVFFIDPSTGMLVAKNSIADGLGSDPVGEEGVMYVASLDQSFYAFSSSSGLQLWRHRTSSPLRSQPAVHDGVVYCEIPGRGMTALQASSGEMLWNVESVGGRVLCQTNGALLVWDDRTLVRMDPGTGDVLGRVTLEDVAMLVPDAFVDPALYAVSDRGVVGRFAIR